MGHQVDGPQANITGLMAVAMCGIFFSSVMDFQVFSFVCEYVTSMHMSIGVAYVFTEPENSHGYCFSPVFKQNLSLTWNSGTLLSLPPQHWDL